jgi:hypothetical protein
MSPRIWRVLGALALAACLGAGGLAGPQAALAATNWLVGRDGTNGGAGRAEPLPAAPGGVNAACVSLLGWSIKVTWNSVPHASSYTIYRSTSSASSGFAVYETVDGGTNSYTDANFSVLTSYWYRVTATVGTNWTGPQSASTPRRSVSLFLVCT